jgi:hypothetical protein
VRRAAASSRSRSSCGCTTNAGAGVEDAAARLASLLI